jgi:hypothetical protein
MQPNKKYNLNEILTNDPLGILDYKKRDAVKNNDQRLADSFHEINDFFEAENREPEKVTDIKERNLYSRLKGIRENPDKISFLKKYDKHNLLENLEKLVKVDSVDDIFNNDPLGILGDSGIDIHTLKNVPEIKKERASADFVARRERCEDFEKYEHIFKSIQDDLKNNKKKLKKFEHGDIRKGSIFVDKGILVFVEDIQMAQEKDFFGKDDGRLVCIFENGTQSNMRFRSLQKSLEINGQTVTENDSVAIISEDDIETGYIYILKSLSNDDRIVTMKNLYKIGFSSSDVKDRIKNAEKDPTYLMAPVAIVTSFRVVNMNPHKLEQLLHKFFGSSRLEIDIIGLDGVIHSPREWFIAPLNVIETAIEMIVSGSILDYRYDSENEVIIPISNIEET